jgi:RNA polymerase sigma-70 factor (ECF subfamily)
MGERSIASSVQDPAYRLRTLYVIRDDRSHANHPFAPSAIGVYEARDLEERLRAGDGFLGVFEDRLKPLVMGIANRYARHHPCEEIYADVAHRVWRSLDSFDWSGKLSGWVGTIARNAAINANRPLSSRATFVPIADGFEVGGVVVPVEPVVLRGQGYRAVRDALDRALVALPSEQAAVLRLVDIEERPYEDVACAMGVPVGTVKSRLFRARRAVRSFLLRSDRALIEDVLYGGLPAPGCPQGDAR